AVSAIWSGQPSSAAAAAILLMTRLMFFSLFSAASQRQFDMASKAAFTASCALLESPGTDAISKRFLASSVILVMGFSSHSSEEHPLGTGIRTGAHTMPTP